MMLQALNCLIENQHLHLINQMVIFSDIIKDFQLDIAQMKYQKNQTYPNIPQTELETMGGFMPQMQQDLLPKQISARVGGPAEMFITQQARVEVLPRVKISPLQVVSTELVKSIMPRVGPGVKMDTPRVDPTWTQVTLTELVLITPQVGAILARVAEIFSSPTVFRQITPLVKVEMAGT